MVLTSKWGRILQEIQCQWQICNVWAQCGQTGQNADKIPRHTSKVNYVRVVLHCAVWAVTAVNPWESENEELMAAAVMEPWHESMIAGRGSTGWRDIHIISYRVTAGSVHTSFTRWPRNRFAQTDSKTSHYVVLLGKLGGWRHMIWIWGRIALWVKSENCI